MVHRSSGLISRRTLILGGALLGTALTPLSAFAQDSTWNGATNIYGTPGNWIPGSVPTNRATFSNTGQVIVVVTANASINELFFAANANPYSFIVGDGVTFNVNGTGITNISPIQQSVMNNGTLIFNNDALVAAGTGGILLSSLAGVTNSSIIFNNNSGMNPNVALVSQGEAASGVGSVSAGNGATATFNDTSHADAATLIFIAGDGGGQGGVGVSGSGTGGSSTAIFNGASHADGATISNHGGNGLAQAGNDPLALGTGTGGFATLTFNGTSHADNADIENRGGGASSLGGGDGAVAIAIGGFASMSFNADTHADGGNFENRSFIALATGGTGASGTPGGTGAAAGGAQALGGTAVILFNDNSHADNATFMNFSNGPTATGGNGGFGDIGNGGNGGNGVADGGTSAITFSGNSHANGATITSGGTDTEAEGGTGGVGGTVGTGGQGGGAAAVGGIASVFFNDNSGANGATITNSAGNAIATGGTGGAGGAGGDGGLGGQAQAIGSSATLRFSGSTTAGTGTTITNQGGNGEATGGLGGTGGVSAGGTGGTGGAANAFGGDATLEFRDNASAGNATITNTAGTATSTGGSGGDGDVGDGGDGGQGFAQAGSATVIFNNSATAGNATITNAAGAATSGANGTAGATGGGGGLGGGPNFGVTQGGTASIIFNDASTGGSARITNQGGLVRFNDNSVFGTSAGASITNTAGQVLFTENSSLGSGAVTNSSTVNFSGTSSGGSGTITNTATGFGRFQDDSNAGSATINNAGNFGFIGNANAGTSVTTNSGTLGFSGTSDAVAARVINTATGIVTIGVDTFRLGSLSGSGSVIINSSSLQVGYLNLNETFAGVISGPGSLLKRGTGTFVLTGQNTYAGTTSVLAGTLQVDGRITSNTSIAAGATLSGIGRISGLIGNNGIISPGNAANPLGTLTVDFGISFNAGSILAPTLNAAGATSLLQAGSLTINAGTVRPTAAPGGLFTMQSDYRIAVGTGGRTGTFGGVDESLLPSFLDASLFYTPTEVFLRVRRNATTFAQAPNLTPNQSAVSTALDAAVAANNPLVFTTYLSTYNALLGLPTGTLPGALNVLSGDALTTLPVTAQDHANRFAHRLDTYTWSNSSNLWGLIAYGDQEGDTDGNGPGFDANGLEFQIGFNTSLGPDTRLGISAGMSNGDVDIDERLATANIDTWSVGAQLRHDFGPVYASGQLTYSWHSIDSSRVLFLGDFATADYDANTWTAAGEIGWVIQSGQLSIEPHVSVRHASTSQDAYSESGPVGVLDVAEADYETTRFGIGVRLANRDPAAPVRFYALARYERETGDEQSALDNMLPGLPTFRVVGTRLGDDILTGDVGVEFRVSSGLSLFAAAGGHTRSNETSLNANAGLRIVF